MKDYFEILQQMWEYYFSSINIEPYEYEVYSKLIDKIKKKDYDFTKEDKIIISKLITILQFECDEYGLKILEIIQKIIDIEKV
jgi:hypothetical protein